MTSPVSSYSQAPKLSDPIGSASGTPAATPPDAASPTASSGRAGGAPLSSGEAVTLTPDAQASTDLLEAARSAAGIDHQAVQSLKAQIISGTYRVPPENLAASIVYAFSETRS